MLALWRALADHPNGDSVDVGGVAVRQGAAAVPGAGISLTVPATDLNYNEAVCVWHIDK